MKALCKMADRTGALCMLPWLPVGAQETLWGNLFMSIMHHLHHVLRSLLVIHIHGQWDTHMSGKTTARLKIILPHTVVMRTKTVFILICSDHKVQQTWSSKTVFIPICSDHKVQQSWISKNKIILFTYSNTCHSRKKHLAHNLYRLL